MWSPGIPGTPLTFPTIRTAICSPVPLGQVFKTQAQKNTAEPVWDETHEFDVVGETDFKMEVYDKDIGKDDLIGEIMVPFKELGLQHGPNSRSIPVFKYVICV